MLDSTIAPEINNCPKCSEREPLIFYSQARTLASLDADGFLRITQEDPLQDDCHVVLIAPDNIMPFLDALCDVCGIPSVGGTT
jgi:hypothetical protein